MTTTITRPPIVPIDFFSINKDLPPPMPVETLRRQFVPSLVEPTAINSYGSILTEDDYDDNETLAVVDVVESQRTIEERYETNWNNFKAMKSKYNGKCSQSGVRFIAGDWILYNIKTSEVYRFDSDKMKLYSTFIKQISEVNL